MLRRSLEFISLIHCKVKCIQRQVLVEDCPDEEVPGESDLGSGVSVGLGNESRRCQPVWITWYHELAP